MLGGTCVRRAAWWLGGMRAVLWQWAGGGLPLPQAKSPPTLAWLVILFEPEPYQWGSGPFMLRGGGGSQEWAIALLGVHTPSRNPPLVPLIQAYIAYALDRNI